MRAQGVLSEVAVQPGQLLGPGPLAVAVGLLAALTGALLVLAGSALLVRTSGSLARAGWAVILVGVVCPLGVVSRLVDPARPGSTSGPIVGGLTQLLVMLVCAGLVVGGVRGWRSRLGTTREGVLAVLAVIAAFASMTVVQLTLDRPLDAPPIAHAALAAVTAAGWVGVAVALAWRRGAATEALLGWPLPAALALAHLGHAATADRIHVLVVVCAGIAAMAAAVMATWTWRGLLEHLRAERTDRACDQQALVAAQGLAVDHADRLAEVTHDARNACAGVKAAVELLCRSEDELDPTTAALLRSVAIAGVSQLEGVIASVDDPAAAVDLTRVVRDVVLSRRPLGTRATVGGAGVAPVAAPAGDLTRIVLNLLVNAEQHGGGEVDLQVRTGSASVRLVVHDRGPGVPPGCHDRIFDRGACGETSRGSGLGLPIARTLARAHGGDLRLVPTPSGARFDLTVPLAGSAPLPSPAAAITAAAAAAAAAPAATAAAVSAGGGVLTDSRDRAPAPVG